MAMLAMRATPAAKYGIFAAILFCLLFLFMPGSTPQRGHISNWVNRVNGELINHLSPQSPYSRSKFKGAGLENFEKPKDIRIVAMVMAGRREYVSILDCYLRRNLVSRGGWLDEVYWIIRTNSQSDTAYLEGIIEEEPEYTGHMAETRLYMNAYKHCRNDTLYIKIDDDVVFWEDHTIPAIVKRKLDHPEYAVVSANVINQPALSWVHYHLNTQHAYLPELTPPTPDFDSEEVEKNVDWRASTLPPWNGNLKQVLGKFNEKMPAPFKGHRWLPLPKSTEIEKTPAGILGAGANFEYASNNSGWHSWAIAAQTHYSFFENLENDELWRYKFDLWDYHYDRISINFLCFAGKDIIAHPVQGSDELYLTVRLPRILGRHAVLDGTALAVHFGFHRQVYGHGGIKGSALNHTDALARYRSYANENICGTSMPQLY